MTTITRLNERAQEAFHAALVTRERTGRWDPILADEYLNREADVRWEEAKADFDALQDRDEDYWAMYETEAEMRASHGDR